MGRGISGRCGAAAVVVVAGLAFAGEDPLRPDRHLELDHAGVLGKADALAAYGHLAAGMAAAYAVSGEPAARAYTRWRRFNDAPYLSETHGNRYVNSYANRVAADAGYGDLRPGVVLPPGAIIAKDSFTYTGEGGLHAGALFLMEKLPSGASPETADWRYVMIMPDGSLFGDTATEAGRASLAFCHDCHRKAADTDHLFFVPEAYRRTPAPE